MRSQYSEKVSERVSRVGTSPFTLVTAVVDSGWAPGGREERGLRETKTTSCFRRCKSLPMTTWWPYRSSAARALGMSSAESVSSYQVTEGVLIC